MGKIGNDGSCTGAGAAAHAGGDEDHIGALENLGDGRAGFLRGLLADLRLGAGAHAAGELLTDGELVGAFGLVQVLTIGIDHQKFHAFHTGAQHAVDDVVAGAANADNLDIYNFFRIICHGFRPPMYL